MSDSTDPPRLDSASREAKYSEYVSLLARHDHGIRRFVRSLMPSDEGVDDVMQETALECWKKFGDFSPQHPDDAVNDFIRWACVIARYKTMSWQRDRSRDRLVFRDDVIESLAQSALEMLDQREAERRAIEGCLGKMDADQRRLVLSVHTPGQSVASIATEMGVQARRLYSRVNLLRKRLLDCVKNDLAGNGLSGDGLLADKPLGSSRT